LTKDEILQETANIEAAKKSNEKIQQSIDSLVTRQTAWYKQRDLDVEKIAKAILELQSVDIEKEVDQHAKLKTYDELSAKIKSLNKERATLEAAVSQAEKTVKKYEKEIATLSNKTCHACEQQLQDHKHTELTTAAIKHLDEAKTYYDKLITDLGKVTSELTEIGDINGRPVTYYDTLEEALKHQNNLTTLESQLTIKAEEKDPYQEQIDELKNTAIQEISWDRVLLTSKDSFIRKKIIDQNLAYLNNRLTYYLDRMGLPHIVSFQNDLNVEITQLGQDLDFDNLSRGERNRLILGLSWAFRDVWESLYQNINLLFIDELIDNGLDASGVEGALSVLKKMARERNKNVYLISHKDELVGRVNNVLKVIKEKRHKASRHGHTILAQRN